VQTEARKVDWEQIERCLALIGKTSKEFLRQALIIGSAEKLFRESSLSIVESKNILQNWHKVKNKTPEIFRDNRLRKRLEPLCVENPNHPVARCLTAE
jgi:hypothetical protein